MHATIIFFTKGGINKYYIFISKYFLLGLEGAETVLDDTPDNLKIVEIKKYNEKPQKDASKVIQDQTSSLMPPRAEWAGLGFSGHYLEFLLFLQFGHSVARRLNVLDISIGTRSKYR
jgi:hypothetical protein